MNKLTFHKLTPGGNTTALVTARFSHKDHARLAKKIMLADPTIEQVGYLEKPRSKAAKVRLQMMGGEFCGNATRAAAFFYVNCLGFPAKRLPIEVSGFKKIITAEISKNTSSITLPGDFFRNIKKIKEGFLVNLKGISHIVVNNEIKIGSKELLKKYSKNLPAIGIIHCKIKDDKIFTKPLIWVRRTGTLIAETGCASGSIAAAIAFHFMNPHFKKFAIVQPSKKIYEVNLKPVAKKFREIILKGEVKYLGATTI